jgi:hypothetical protein
MAVMEESGWSEKCLELVAKALRSEERVRLRCRGIGCVGRSDIAQQQCAFALLLQKRFGNPDLKVDFCEPMLEKIEVAAVEELGK